MQYESKITNPSGSLSKRFEFSYYEYKIGNKIIYGWKGWGCGPFAREVK